MRASPNFDISDIAIKLVLDLVRFIRELDWGFICPSQDGDDFRVDLPYLQIQTFLELIPMPKMKAAMEVDRKSPHLESRFPISDYVKTSPYARREAARGLRILIAAVRRKAVEQEYMAQRHNETADEDRYIPEMLMKNAHIRGHFAEGEAGRPAEMSTPEFQSPFNTQTWMRDYGGKEVTQKLRAILPLQMRRRKAGVYGPEAKESGYG